MEVLNGEKEQISISLQSCWVLTAQRDNLHL